MKSVFFFSLLFFSFHGWSAATSGWSVIAETTNHCNDKVQVLAKEGEKFIYVSDGTTKTKLIAEDGSAFSEESGKSVTFTNANNKSLNDKDKRYTFIQPSMVDGNPPKLDIVMNGKLNKCKTKFR